MPSSAEPRSNDCVSIRGARTHNLKSVDLDVPYYCLLSLCGPSGSGKSSLAFDVLYAEGQRRYVESLSPYARQYLEQLERPIFDSIEGLLPAIAVTAQATNANSRASVGMATEINDYLAFVFAKLGAPYCQSCGKRIRSHSPTTVLKTLRQLPDGVKAMIAFAPPLRTMSPDPGEFKKTWSEEGIARGIILGESFDLSEQNSAFDRNYALARMFYLSMEDENGANEMENLGLRTSSAKKEKHVEGAIDEENEVFDEEDETPELNQKFRVRMLDARGDDSSLMRYLRKFNAIDTKPGAPSVFFIVDRVKIGSTPEPRLNDSLETAFHLGEGHCWIFVEGECALRDCDECASDGELGVDAGEEQSIDGKKWTLFGFSKSLRCEACGFEIPKIQPNLFNPESPNGACPVCSGFGWWSAFDMERVFPNPLLSIEDGAIAPWNVSAYRGKLREFKGCAEELGVPIDKPFSSLNPEQVNAILNGSPKLNYKGLNGFFSNLLAQRYKMHIRSYLSRWQKRCECPICHGARLNQKALAVKLDGDNIFQWLSLSVVELIKKLEAWELDDAQIKIAEYPLRQVCSRLYYLEKVGLGYVTLERDVKTLSSGENRRIKLTTALGSDLADMLYVLDEPSIGLHPEDSLKLQGAVKSLRDRGNTVVVVDHNPILLEASDQIVELGPGAGEDGGKIVFKGTFEEMKNDPNSLTGSYLTGRRIGAGVSRRAKSEKFIELWGAHARNLNIEKVAFPLNALCVVTGVSGAGKSSLVQDTLYPALCAKLGGDQSVVDAGLPYEKISGVDAVDEVVFIDQTPIGRSPRSNPVTYLKIFDDIRNLFAEQPYARSRGYAAGYFSFNVAGGRCDYCKGEGFVLSKMQYSSDFYFVCPYCNGKRYQRSVLEVMYRGLNIAETLEMTAKEAVAHFRGQTKIQQKLKRLVDVGLDYLQLGQPANTLSGGESQRLKLAASLLTTQKGPCLYLMDEPTSGLHFADVVKLLDCFEELIQAGNSLIVVEHNPLVLRVADHIVDLGPGAGKEGGRIVAEGTPEEVAANPNSRTGRFIAQALQLGSGA